MSIPCAVYNPFHGFRLALANLKPAYFSETRMSIKIYIFFQIFVVKYFGISIVASYPVAEKRRVQAAQKDLRGEARGKSMSGGVRSEYVVARRLSATKHMSLFQQRAST
jgi:hypothetical protein